MKCTTIHGSKITAALLANLHHSNKYQERITRVWCEDGTLHLVTGYEYGGTECNGLPCFNTIVGYWEVPENETYLSTNCKEIITRPTFLTNKK